MTFGLPKVVLSYQYWQSRLEELGACHPEPPPSVARLTAISLAVRQREQAFVLPPMGVVWVAPFRQGRSVRYHSRWSFLMLPHSLDCILAFLQSVTSIFPFIAFTKCALIYQLRWYVRPTGFLQNSNLSKHREMCSHSLRSLGYISRLLGSILRPLFQLDIYGEPEPSMSTHLVGIIATTSLRFVGSARGGNPLVDSPIRGLRHLFLQTKNSPSTASLIKEKNR